MLHPTRTMLAAWLLVVFCVCCAALGGQSPRRASGAFDVVTDSSSDVARAVNGSLAPSSSVILIRVRTVSCSDDDASRWPAAWSAACKAVERHERKPPGGGLEELREWLDEHYGCTTAACWYSFVDIVTTGTDPDLELVVGHVLNVTFPAPQTLRSSGSPSALHRFVFVSRPTMFNPNTATTSRVSARKTWHEGSHLVHAVRDMIDLTLRIAPPETSRRRHAVIEAHRYLHWLAHRSTAAKKPTDSVVVGVRGSPTQPLASLSRWYIEPATVFSQILAEYEQGGAARQVLHAAAQLLCSNRSSRTANEATVAHRACWAESNRLQRRVASMLVLEQEFTSRIAHYLPTQQPLYSRRGVTRVESGEAVETEEGDHILHGEQLGSYVLQRRLDFPVMQRVDSIDELRRAVVGSASRLHSESLPFVHVARPPSPQRVALLQVNVSHHLPDGDAGDRILVKLQGLLTSPRYYGQLRCYYYLVGDFTPSAESRQLIAVTHGELTYHSAAVTVTFLSSLGRTIPLSSHRVLLHDQGDGHQRTELLRSAADVSGELLDRFASGAHPPPPAAPAAHLRETSRFLTFPLRRLRSALDWHSHVVTLGVGVTVMMLLPEHVVLLPRRLQHQEALAYVAERVSDYFLPIRSSKTLANVFSLHVPVMDDDGKVVAYPLSSTTSTRRFEDHLAQLWMGIAKISQLPAAIIVYAPSPHGANATSSSEGRRHVITVSASRKKAIGSNAKTSRKPRSSTVPKWWNASAIIEEVRHVGEAARTKKPTSADYARYVGTITQQRLEGLVLGDAEESHTDEDAYMSNPEAWVETAAASTADDYAAYERPFHVSRSSLRSSASAPNTSSDDNASAVSDPRSLSLRDKLELLREPQRKRQPGSTSRTRMLGTGWDALRDAAATDHSKAAVAVRWAGAVGFRQALAECRSAGDDPTTDVMLVSTP